MIRKIKNRENFLKPKVYSQKSIKLTNFQPDQTRKKKKRDKLLNTGEKERISLLKYEIKKHCKPTLNCCM